MGLFRLAPICFSVMVCCAVALLPVGCSVSSAPRERLLVALEDAMILPPPPPDDSAEHQAELELVLRAQRSATREDLARAESEYKLTLDAFRSVLGPWCGEENLPATRRLIKAAAAIADPLAAALKTHYRRARPPVGDSAIKPLDLPHFDHESYPSWHAARGILYAEILAELLPARREGLLRRGQEIGWDRVIAGMHHPSDITAGRILAHLVVRDLMRRDPFRSLLGEARREVEAAAAAGSGVGAI